MRALAGARLSEAGLRFGGLFVIGISLLGAPKPLLADSITLYAVNDSGLIVGQDYTTQGIYESFLYNPSTQTYTFLTPPGAINSIAVGINDSGQIVGTYETSSGNYGYLYSGGTYSTLSVPGATQSPGTVFYYASMIGTNAAGINDDGEIVGEWSGPSGEAGFTYSGGVFTDTSISEGAGVGTILYGVNDSGLISGYTATFVDEHSVKSSFLYNGSTFTPIDYPGSSETIVQGINDSGEAVGFYTLDGQTWGFIYNGGTYTSIAYPGSSETMLFGISNNGEIVGSYSCSSGLCPSSDPAFYAVPTQSGYSFQTVDAPTPEPASMLLIGAGLAGLVAAGKKVWKWRYRAADCGLMSSARLCQ
jgi:PEP-CTERM motif